MNLVEYKGCSATQLTSKGQKGDWKVCSASGEELFTLPFDMNEQHVMRAIHMARDAELRALNIGIDYGKKLSRDTIKRLEDKCMKLGNENIRISNTLQRHIIKGTESLN